MDAVKLSYTHLTAGWPAWLLMSTDDGMIKGVPDTVGTSIVTVIGTD